MHMNGQYPYNQNMYNANRMSRARSLQMQRNAGIHMPPVNMPHMSGINMSGAGNEILGELGALMKGSQQMASSAGGGFLGGVSVLAQAGNGLLHNPGLGALGSTVLGGLQFAGRETGEGVTTAANAVGHAASDVFGDAMKLF